jgi:hypothetical protein
MRAEAIPSSNMNAPPAETGLGNLYVKYGFEYYHIMNDALLAAQEITAGASGIANVNGTFPQAHRGLVVGFGGVGFTF